MAWHTLDAKKRRAMHDVLEGHGPLDVGQAGGSSGTETGQTPLFERCHVEHRDGVSAFQEMCRQVAADKTVSARNQYVRQYFHVRPGAGRASSISVTP